MKVVAVLVCLLAVVGCGGEAEQADGREIRTDGPVTVLDAGRGARLCLDGVLESFPPQCVGPRLVGWDWSEHAGHFEQAGEVRWGEFVVTGRYDGDGESITPIDVVAAAVFKTAPSYAEEVPERGR